jgi:hypothetical protein
MTRQEALEVTQMVLTNWRVRDWTKEEIDGFATGIQHLDGQIAVASVARASRELKYAPKISEFLEVYRAERATLRAAMIDPPDPQSRPMEPWVREWMCARYLYANFGRERDMRRFPEQGEFGDLTQELMPEGAWRKEAESLGDDELLRVFRKTGQT